MGFKFVYYNLCIKPAYATLIMEVAEYTDTVKDCVDTMALLSEARRSQGAVISDAFGQGQLLFSQKDFDRLLGFFRKERPFLYLSEKNLSDNLSRTTNDKSPPRWDYPAPIKNTST
jgi:hypothetical protein